MSLGSSQSEGGNEDCWSQEDDQITAQYQTIRFTLLPRATVRTVRTIKPTFCRKIKDRDTISQMSIESSDSREPIFFQVCSLFLTRRAESAQSAHQSLSFSPGWRYPEEAVGVCQRSQVKVRLQKRPRGSKCSGVERTLGGKGWNISQLRGERISIHILGGEN